MLVSTILLATATAEEIASTGHKAGRKAAGEKAVHKAGALHKAAF